jgi:hypothetical protein
MRQWFSFVIALAMITICASAQPSKRSTSLPDSIGFKGFYLGMPKSAVTALVRTLPLRPRWGYGVAPNWYRVRPSVDTAFSNIGCDNNDICYEIGEISFGFDSVSQMLHAMTIRSWDYEPQYVDQARSFGTVVLKLLTAMYGPPTYTYGTSIQKFKFTTLDLKGMGTDKKLLYEWKDTKHSVQMYACGEEDNYSIELYFAPAGKPGKSASSVLDFTRALNKVKEETERISAGH